MIVLKPAPHVSMPYAPLQAGTKTNHTSARSAPKPQAAATLLLVAPAFEKGPLRPATTAIAPEHSSFSGGGTGMGQDGLAALNCTSSSFRWLGVELSFPFQHATLKYSPPVRAGRGPLCPCGPFWPISVA